MATRHRFGASRFWLLSLGIVGCQKDPEPDALPTAIASASAPAPVASASARPPSYETPFVGQEMKVGSLVETSAYKFKVHHVVRCANPEATEKVPEDRRVRVAAKVEIFSKYDDFFVQGKDLDLEKDGVVIQAERQAKPSSGCTPLLAQKRLKHDETSTGYVIFQVPDEAFVRGASIAFEPTRWGSAPRATVPIGAKDFSAQATAPRSSK